MKKISRIIFLCGLVYFSFSSYASFACGPYFDEAYLVRGSKEQFLSLPEGSFLYELEKIAGQKRKLLKKHELYKSSVEADISDLKEAVDELNIGSERRKQVWEWYGGSFRSYERCIPRPTFKFSPDFEFSPDLPEEFVLYIKGAAAYHSYNFKAAIKEWKKLIRLPKEKRQYKTVWAYFMIGKAYLSMREAEKSIGYFEKARLCASKGFKDSLNLAFDSYGWQALAEYESKKYTESINHYLKQLDLESLSWVCLKIFALDEREFQKIVKDDVSRKVLIAWAISRSPWTYWYRTKNNDPNQNIYFKLFKAIEKLDIKQNIENADRIAWICYNFGDFESSKKWLSFASGGSPLAQWIKSKLLLRQGKIDESIKILKGLIPLFEKNEEWNMFYKISKPDVIRSISTEIGLLQLRRQDYLSALDTLVKGKAYWEDIAYIAEKVLTTEELEEYLKQPPPGSEVNIEWLYPSNLDKPTVYNALRYLLARRFARLGNWEKALEYMPTSFMREWTERALSEEGYTVVEQKQEIFSPRKKLMILYKNLKKGQDVKLSKEERAQSYYQAGLIMRKYGMELMGTELDPDWFVFNGQYAYDNTMEQRFAIMSDERINYYKGWYEEEIKQIKKRRQEIEKQGRDFFVGSEDEERRVLSSLPSPNKRFHYRYKAADFMWKCAELLPDNHELKAKALCLGGTYLKIRDPQAADRFYKELVKTCPKTKLGKNAERLHWFPKIK